MKILDRYIARQYLVNAAALLVIIFSLVIAIDASWNIEAFYRNAGQAAAASDKGSALAQAWDAVALVVEFWWPRLFLLFNYLIGLVMVAAMGFTCVQMVRHRELTAVLASGQSLHRVARPILLASAALILFQGINQEVILPVLAPRLAREHDDVGKPYLRAEPVELTADGQGRLFYAKSYDPDARVMSGVEIWERDATGRTVRRLSAPRAAWTGAGWELAGARIEERPEDRPGVAARTVPTELVKTDLDPTGLMMRRFSGYGQNLSWRTISRMLAQGPLLDDRTRERLQRYRWGRLSTMLCNLATVALTLPFFLTREPRDAMVQSLRCAPLAVGAVVGSVLGTSVGVPGVPVQVSVFIPLMALIPAAIAMLGTIRT